MKPTALLKFIGRIGVKDGQELALIFNCKTPTAKPVNNTGTKYFRRGSYRTFGYTN